MRVRIYVVGIVFLLHCGFDGAEQTSLVCLQVFFAVLIGAFSLGQAAPNFESFLTAAGAAGTVFEIIDRVISFRVVN